MAAVAPLSARFAGDGFVVLESVVPPRMLRRLFRQLHAVAREAEAEVIADSGSWDTNKSGASADACDCTLLRDAAGKALLPRRLFKAQGIALRCPEVLELLRLPAIAQTARELADLSPSDDLDVFGTKYFPVHAGTIGSVGWHDDNYYFGTTRSRTISCAVYLSGTEARRGNLRVVKGSHCDTEVGEQRAAHYRPSIEQNGEFIPDGVVCSAKLTGKKREALEVTRWYM